METDAHLRAVKKMAIRSRVAEGTYMTARDRLYHAIQAAKAAGCSTGSMAAATGLTRQRVNQILTQVGTPSERLAASPKRNHHGG